MRMRFENIRRRSRDGARDGATPAVFEGAVGLSGARSARGRGGPPAFVVLKPGEQSLDEATLCEFLKNRIDNSNSAPYRFLLVDREDRHRQDYQSAIFTRRILWSGKESGFFARGCERMAEQVYIP